MPVPRHWNDWTVTYLVHTRRVILAHCRRCGHAAEVDPLAILTAHGEHFTVRQARRRLVCTACKALNHPYHDVEVRIADA